MSFNYHVIQITIIDACYVCMIISKTIYLHALWMYRDTICIQQCLRKILRFVNFVFTPTKKIQNLQTSIILLGCKGTHFIGV